MHNEMILKLTVSSCSYIFIYLFICLFNYISLSAHMMFVFL